MSGIYQLLAQDCNDALATFAYAAYKQHKSDVIEAILAKTGRPATEEDLAAFYLNSKHAINESDVCPTR